MVSSRAGSNTAAAYQAAGGVYTEPLAASIGSHQTKQGASEEAPVSRSVRLHGDYRTVTTFELLLLLLLLMFTSTSCVLCVGATVEA